MRLTSNTKKFQMNKTLNDALGLMKKSRELLVNSYTEKNSDRYWHSFRYYNSPAAMEIAACLMDHCWMDELLSDAQHKLEHQEISKASFDMVVRAIQKSSIFHNESAPFDGYRVLLSTKKQALSILLESSESLNRRFHSLEFARLRDKVLFEKEMEKYEKEALSNLE